MTTATTAGTVVLELIEILAEGSHASWMAEKQRQGYADHTWAEISDHPGQCAARIHFGPSCTLLKERHHPDMLPYADLSEATKEYDRVTVRGVLSGIDAAGYAIVTAAGFEIVAALDA